MEESFASEGSGKPRVFFGAPVLGSSGNIILQNVYESLLTDLSPKDATLEGFNVYMQGLGEFESPASLNSFPH